MYMDDEEEPTLGSSVGGSAAKGSSAGPWGALIGAGMGLMKFQNDKGDYARKADLAANTDRLSYFTHRKGDVPAPISGWGNALAFGSQGAQYGQNLDNQKMQQQLQAGYLRNMDAQTKFYSGRTPSTMPYGSTVTQPHRSSFWGDMVASPLDDENNMSPRYDLSRMGS